MLLRLCLSIRAGFSLILIGSLLNVFSLASAQSFEGFEKAILQYTVDEYNLCEDSVNFYYGSEYYPVLDTNGGTVTFYEFSRTDSVDSFSTRFNTDLSYSLFTAASEIIKSPSHHKKIEGIAVFINCPVESWEYFVKSFKNWESQSLWCFYEILMMRGNEPFFRKLVFRMELDSNGEFFIAEYY